MLIVDKKLTRKELSEIALNFFTEMVKGIVDVEREILAIDAEMHADLESFLLERGCCQKNLWGINLYPDLSAESFIEYDSMINIRPSQNNRSRGVEDPILREKIKNIVESKIDA